MADSDKELYEFELDDEKLKFVSIMFEGMISAGQAEDPEMDVRQHIIDDLEEKKRVFNNNIDGIVERLKKNGLA